MSKSAILKIGLAQPSGGGAPFDVSIPFVRSADNTIRATIPALSTGFFVCGAFLVAPLTLVVVAVTADCTCKTNSAGSPVDTIDFKAGHPYVWDGVAAYDPLKFTADVTALYFDSVDECEFELYLLC